MRLVPVDDSLLEATVELLGVVYNKGVPFATDRDFVTYNKLWAMLDGGDVVGAFGALPMDALVHGTPLGCGGIGAVAVSPHARAKGVGTQMMRDYIREAREAGMPLASLYAFRETFYRRAGYEACGRRFNIEIARASYPKIKSHLPVRRLKASESKEFLDGCYQEFIRHFNGACTRPGKLWKRMLPDNQHKHVYVAGEDKIEGYLMIQHDDAFWANQAGAEIAYTTQAGMDAVFATLFATGSNKTSVSFREPSNSPFLAKYLDQGMKTETFMQIMFRITDLPAVLAAFKPTAVGSFVFELVDDTIPGESGIWQVDMEAQAVAKRSTRAPDFTLTIHQLTQAIMGEPSLDLLAEWGQVAIKNPKGFELARQLFVPKTVYCLDFF